MIHYLCGYRGTKGYRAHHDASTNICGGSANWYMNTGVSLGPRVTEVYRKSPEAYDVINNYATSTPY